MYGLASKIFCSCAIIAVTFVFCFHFAKNTKIAELHRWSANSNKAKKTNAAGILSSTKFLRSLWNMMQNRYQLLMLTLVCCLLVIFFLSSNTTLTRCHLLAGWDCGLLIYAHGKLTGQHAACCFKAPISLFYVHKGAEKSQQRAETQIAGMNNM